MAKSDLMKNLLLSITLLMASFALLAQDSNKVKAFYPEVGDWGVVGNVSGIIAQVQTATPKDLRNENLFLIRYKKSEQLTFRLGIAPNVMNVNVSSTDSVGKDLVRFDSTASRSTIAFKPGVEYHLKGTHRLDPYLAGEVELGVVGGMNIGSSTNITDTTGTSLITRTITEDGGFSLGLKLSAGMNFYIAPKLFVGAEYGVGLTSVTTGGDRQEVVQYNPVSGSDYSQRNLSSIRTTNTNLVVDPTIKLTVGYFFGFNRK